MDLWLIWIVAGFALVIAELLTGTFYLLVIGLGAFAGALVAWMGANLLIQAVLGGGVSLAGALAVHHWHQAQLKTQTGNSNFLDKGQAVVLEGWANETARIARVRYRGTTWDARLAHAGEHPPPGATLYIVGQEGNTFVVDLAPSPA